MYEYVLPEDFTQIFPNWNTNDSMPQEASSSVITQSMHVMQNKANQPYICVATIGTRQLSQARGSIKTKSSSLIESSRDISSDLKGWHEIFRKFFENFDFYPVPLKFEHVSLSSVKRIEEGRSGQTRPRNHSLKKKWNHWLGHKVKLSGSNTNFLPNVFIIFLYISILIIMKKRQ